MTDTMVIIIGLCIVLIYMWFLFLETKITLRRLEDKIDKFQTYIGQFEDELDQIRQFEN